MGKKVSIRYLIDVAIGNPEPGIVNFNALYTVLQAISEKLDLDDEQIEVDSSYCPVTSNPCDSKSNLSSERLMNHQKYDIPTLQCEKDEQCTLNNRSGDLTADDRKIIFNENKNKSDDTEGLSHHATKKSRNIELWQQMDCLVERLTKIENFAESSLDTEQSVECLRQIVHNLQGKIDILENLVSELRDKRYNREVDISACKIKLEYDKLSIVTEALREDLNELKQSIQGNCSKNIQIKKASDPSPHYLEATRNFETQLIELKTQVCVICDKLTSLEEMIARTIERCSPFVTLDLFQHEISTLKARIENLTSQDEHQMLKETINKLEEEIKSKIDKEEVNERLSEKADYIMLHRKVSIEFMNAEHRKFEKQLAEITDCVILNEEHSQKQIDDIKQLISNENLKDILNEFKLKINKDIQEISESLQKLTETKPDIDSAVTRLKDLTCLSCDQDVVMKAIEVNNLTKFNDAHVSKSIGPSITFEVGKLREAGKIGLFNDDDIIFQLEKEFRRSGGVHTIVTNKDRISKTRVRKSK